MRRLVLPLVSAAALALVLACGGLGTTTDAPPAPPAPPSETASDGKTDARRPPAEVLDASGDTVLEPVFVGTSRTWPSDGGYPAWKAFDGEVGSTWVAEVEESLHIALPRSSVPGTLELIPGFAVDARRWAKNRRPTRLRLRYRYRDGTTSPWQEHEVASAAALTDDPWATLDLSPPEDFPEGLEIQVTQATPTPPGGDDDICISEIRVRGDLHAIPTFTGPWVIPDRLQALDTRETSPFTEADFEGCAFEQDTGGTMAPTFDVTCTPVEGGYRLVGEARTMCAVDDGETLPPLCGEREAPVPVDRVVTVEVVSPCMAVIDGHPFTRTGC